MRGGKAQKATDGMTWWQDRTQRHNRHEKGAGHPNPPPAGQDSDDHDAAGQDEQRHIAPCHLPFKTPHLPHINIKQTRAKAHHMLYCACAPDFLQENISGKPTLRHSESAAQSSLAQEACISSKENKSNTKKHPNTVAQNGNVSFNI